MQYGGDYCIKAKKWQGAIRLIEYYERCYPSLFRDLSWGEGYAAEIIIARFRDHVLQSDKMTWMVIFSILLFCAQFDQLNSCQRAKLFSDVGLTKVSSYFLNPGIQFTPKNGIGSRSGKLSKLLYLKVL